VEEVHVTVKRKAGCWFGITTMFFNLRFLKVLKGEGPKDGEHLKLPSLANGCREMR